MKIVCIKCGFKIDLDDNTYRDFEGPVRCSTCKTLLEIWTQEGCLKKMAFLSSAPEVSARFSGGGYGS